MAEVETSKSKSYSEAIAAAFEWSSRASSWRLVGALFVVSFGFLLLTTAFTPNLAAGGQPPSSYAELGLFLVLMLAEVLVVAFVELFVFRDFLSRIKLSSIVPSALNALRLFFLGIVTFLIACVPVFQPVLLVVPVVFLIFGFLFASTILDGSQLYFFLAMLSLAAYIAVIAYGLVRLSFGTYGLLVEKKGVWQSLKYSWSFTQGRFWKAFGLLFVPGIVVGVVILIGSLLGFALVAIDSALRIPAPGVSGVWTQFLAAIGTMAFLGYNVKVYSALRAERK